MTADEVEIQGARSEIGEAIQRVLDEKAPMTAADTRLIAQLVAGKRVHCVSDESVMALARRVLELEADAEEHAAYVRAVEREACAKLCDEVARSTPSVSTRMERDVASALALAIRARGLERIQSQEASE